MLRKRVTGFGGGGGGLPTTTGEVPDGSGRSIKMEAPVAKAIRNADGFIKGSYIWLFISIFFIWGGWSWMRRNSASMVFDCNAEGCTLTIQTPYRFLPRGSKDGILVKTSRSRKKRRTVVKLTRDQVVRADNVKWNPVTQSIVENYGLDSPTYAAERKAREEEEKDDDEEGFRQEGDRMEDGGGPKSKDNRPYNQQRKSKKNRAKAYKKNYSSAYSRMGGPDAEGNYDSYVVVLRDPLPQGGEEEEDPEESPSMKMARKMAKQHQSMTKDPNSLASLLAPFVVDDGGKADSASTEYMIHLRDFNMGQTRRLARTAVSKLIAYTKGRRATCILRESRPVAWQGLVLLILGIFSLVLSLLIGQFWEEYDPTKVGSYRSRMAEVRRREEARKLRLQKQRRGGAGRRPATRRPTGGSSQSSARRSSGGTQPSARRPVENSAPRPSSTASGTMRARTTGVPTDAQTKRNY